MIRLIRLQRSSLLDRCVGGDKKVLQRRRRFVCDVVCFYLGGAKHKKGTRTLEKRRRKHFIAKKSAKKEKNVLTHIPLSARILGPYSQPFIFFVT
jgi:hypothetical protein